MGASARTNPERTTIDATSVPTNDRPPRRASRRNSAATASPARRAAAAVPSAPPAAISVRILCSWCSKSRSRSARSRSRSSRRASSRADSRSTSRRSSAICSFSILTSRGVATRRDDPTGSPAGSEGKEGPSNESRGIAGNVDGAGNVSRLSRAFAYSSARDAAGEDVLSRVESTSSLPPRANLGRRCSCRWGSVRSRRRPRGARGKRRGLLGFERSRVREALGFGCASGGASASSSPLGSSAADPPPRRRLVLGVNDDGAFVRLRVVVSASTPVDAGSAEGAPSLVAPSIGVG